MDSFHPPLRTLMGPGPSDIHLRIREAMSRPAIGHLDPAFIAMMDEVKEGLRAVFRTKNALTFPVSAPGSAGMEICFVNLVEPGDKVIICQNGAFGGRMQENVERCGGVPIVVACEWGAPIDVEQVDDICRQNQDAKILAFVHAETSTGVRANAAALCALARAHHMLSIVDAVTSLGGSPVDVDAWGADAVYSGTQKCLSCTPGLSPVTFSAQAIEKVRTRKTKVQSWFLDLNLLLGYWEGDAKNKNKNKKTRAYHHTAPINALYGLHESLVMLHEEGLDNAIARHTKMHNVLKAGLDAMGLQFLVAEEHRLPQLNSILIPDGVQDADVRTRLLQDFNLEIGAGLGPLTGKIWRIGVMGHSARFENITLCLSALETTLAAMQAPITPGKALAAAQAAYQDAYTA